MPDNRTCSSKAELGDEKYLSRIRILHFLAGGVTGDIDVAATRIEGTENVAGFSGYGLGGRKGLRRRGTRWARGRFRFFRDPRRGRLWARAGPDGRSRRILRGGRPLRTCRGWRNGSARRGDGVGRNGGRRRRGFGVAVDPFANVTRWRVEDAE